MNPTTLTVRHTPLSKDKVPEGAVTLDKVCSAGTVCAAVQNDPLAKQALAALQTKTTALHASLSGKQQAAQALLAASKVMWIDLAAAGEALTNYEAAVRTVAAGDGSIINAAGLLSRPVRAPAQPLSIVTEVAGKKGKEPGQGIVSWPAAPGATSYALQVNFTPQTPASPYTMVSTGTKRSRVVKAPATGAQFLAQVAAVASDGTMAAWSDAILVTAR
jgi:hypothetical protein